MSNILIIDDEEDIRDVLQLILESAGFDVRVASNGIEGVKEQRREPADVIITDIVMPEKDGISTINEIKKITPDVKVIAISGGGGIDSISYKPESITTSAYLAAAEQVGADQVFTKPFERSEIISAVESLSI